MTVHEMVRMFDDFGVGGISIADQEFPERCGRMRGKEPIHVSTNIGFGISGRPTTAPIPMPRMLPAAAIRSMEQIQDLFRHSIEISEVVDRPDPLASIKDIEALMDYEGPDRLEERFVLPDQRLHKYGNGRVTI